MYNAKKQKSFLYNVKFIWIMLLTMGAVFIAVAAIIQLVPISPENMNLRINGVQQEATEDTVRTFRLIFLLVFGIIGLGMLIAGSIVAGRAGARRSLFSRLKSGGVRVTAEVVGFAPSSVHVNYQTLSRLQCAYNGAGGKTYIFKSGFLRMDPTPYLPESKVIVYYDRDNMSRYFVDVDGSAGVGDRVVEL